MRNPIMALVVKEIILPNLTIAVDEVVMVDPDNFIALWEKNHFDIFPDEYIIIQ